MATGRLGRFAGAALWRARGPIALDTDSAVIAGPYHRDRAGILDSYEIFAGKNRQAVLHRRSIAYLMTCRAAPDWEFYRKQGD